LKLEMNLFRIAGETIDNSDGKLIKGDRGRNNRGDQSKSNQRIVDRKFQLARFFGEELEVEDTGENVRHHRASHSANQTHKQGEKWNRDSNEAGHADHHSTDTISHPFLLHVSHIGKELDLVETILLDNRHDREDLHWIGGKDGKNQGDLGQDSPNIILRQIQGDSIRVDSTTITAVADHSESQEKESGKNVTDVQHSGVRVHMEHGSSHRNHQSNTLVGKNRHSKENRNTSHIERLNGRLVGDRILHREHHNYDESEHHHNLSDQAEIGQDAEGTQACHSDQEW